MKVSVKRCSAEDTARSNKAQFKMPTLPKMTAVLPSDLLKASEPQKLKYVARVIVSPRAFRAWWVAIIAIHCFCGLFLGYVGAMYLYLVDSEVIFDFSLYSMTIDKAHYPAVANMYFVLAAIHGLLVLFIVFRSVQARQLVFRKPRQEVAPSTSRKDVDKTSTLSQAPSQDSKKSLHSAGKETRKSLLAQRLSSWANVFSAALRGFFAACDVRHRNYGVVFLVRELILTSLQTYQTYRLSCLVPRRWMNNVMVGLLVLNCWATPLLLYLFRSNVGRIRLGGAVVNMVLDMVSYIGLPAALLVPYAAQFNTVRKQFDRLYWYSDMWLIGAINEAQMIFVTSLYDAISKFLIALSVSRGLYSITKLICTADQVKLSEAANARRRKADSTPVTPFASFRVLSSMTLSLRPAALGLRLENLGHRLLLLWGLLLLIAHLHASFVPAHLQCRLPIRPWFGARPACSLVEFNCVEEGAAGSEAEVDRILRIFDPDRVEYIVIRHCPELVVPARIQTLKELLGFKVFNSTICDWGEAAAVTSTHHPELRFVFIVDVKLHEFPLGLQSQDFPQTLRDIEFSRTNLSVIPDTLDKIWPSGMYIAFEECEMQEFPQVLRRIQALDLALALNNFSFVPQEMFEGVPLRIFSVAGSPIRSLPDTLKEPPPIVWWGLIGTQISELPDWIDEAFLASVFIVASNTPLCDRLIAAGEASEFESSALIGVPGLDCSVTFMGNSSLNWYPIDIEGVINPSYSLS